MGMADSGQMQGRTLGGAQAQVALCPGQGVVAGLGSEHALHKHADA